MREPPGFSDFDMGDAAFSTSGGGRLRLDKSGTKARTISVLTNKTRGKLGIFISRDVLTS